MATHRPHPITGPWPHAIRDDHLPGEPVSLAQRIPTADSLIYDDPDDALLYDGCDRCAQHAEHPSVSLDDDRLGQLWQRMVEVERDPTYLAHYRTRTEGNACRRLYETATLIERTHPGIDPWRWPWTFRVEGAGGFGRLLDEPWHLSPAEER